VLPFYLDLEDAAKAVALSPSSLERLVREGVFPRPRQLGPRRVGWYVPDLAKWAEERPVADNLPPENTGRRRPKPATGS
jgi:prophage regulatory protein